MHCQHSTGWLSAVIFNNLSMICSFFNQLISIVCLVCLLLQLQALVIAAFKSSKKLSCRSSGCSSLPLELAVLSLWQAIAALAAAQGVAAAKQAAISNVLATAAEGLLKDSWVHNEEEAEEGSKGKQTAEANGSRPA